MATPRYRHTRELAGLTLGQGSRLLGIDVVRLSDIELERSPATEGEQRRMSDVYGCSVEWLRGDHVEPPADLVKALRDKGVEGRDRETVLEFAAMLQGTPPPRRLADVAKALATVVDYDQTADEAEAELLADGVDVERFIERVHRDVSVERKRRYVRSQRQTRDHHCHWPGCDKQVPPAMWGCRAHWFKLPKALRDRIWATYSPGQEIDMTPSNEYLQAADEVQRWIRESGNIGTEQK